MLDSRKLQTPLDYFYKFFDLKLIKMFVKETNIFYKQTQKKKAVNKPKSIKEPTTDEIYTLLGLAMLMPLVKKTINNYWSTDEFVLTPIFRKFMSRNRYKEIWTHLHFANNEQQQPNDQLFKLCTVTTDLTRMFLRFFSTSAKSMP